MMLGAPCIKHHGSFRSGGTGLLGGLPLAFGETPKDSCDLCSLARLAFCLAGVPITYPTMAIGSKPYKTKVKKAPNTLPTGLVASAMAIINATYNQAIKTKYI